MTGRNRTLGLACMALILAISVSGPVVPAHGNPLERLESWAESGTRGWTNGTATATVTNPGGFLNLRHHSQGGMPTRASSDVARLPIPVGLMPTNLSFRFESINVIPSAVRVYMHSREGRRSWYVSLDPPARNESANFSVAARHDAGWIAGPESTRNQFESDLHSVDWVGVYVRRHGAATAQDYAVDDFLLQGIGNPDDADLDRIPDDYERLHGLDPSDWMDASEDSDGDTMSNFEEYWAGTDATNVLSWFAVEVTGAVAPGEKPVVWWKSISNRTYAVWQSTNLLEGFTQVESGIASKASINEYPVPTNRAAYFYRIEVEDN